jgi:hypothetical protein
VSRAAPTEILVDALQYSRIETPKLINLAQILGNRLYTEIGDVLTEETQHGWLARGLVMPMALQLPDRGSRCGRKKPTRIRGENSAAQKLPVALETRTIRLGALAAERI